jgi:hypothetical protein
MVLLGGKPMATGQFELIFDTCQREVAFDLINQAILSSLGLASTSSLEQAVSHLKVVSEVSKVLDRGFQGITPVEVL